MKFFIQTVFLTLALASCGGGGGDNGSSDLSTDACSAIGLPTKSLRIVNGTACGNLTASPVVRVAIFDSGAQPLGYCTGTMIAPNAVLTAAHCVAEGAAAAAIIWGNTGSAQTTLVNKIIVHPNYIPSSEDSPNFAAYNDVAVFQLANNLPLPTSPLLRSQSVQSGGIISIFGYGTDENGNFDFKELKSGEMLVNSVSPANISAIFNGQGSNTCQGDSGGPAYTEINGVAVLAGVTSTGTVENCAKGDDSLFINVQTPEVLNFILAQAPGAKTL